MIQIRYRPYEIYITGTPEKLRSVRHQILNLLQLHEVQVDIPADANFEPAPYNRLDFLSIYQTRGAVKLSVSANFLKVEGEASKLAVLAECFNFSDGSRRGSHSHVEYYEDHEWIASDSIPCVIGVRQPQS
ncbi:Imm32 family immunity protein [Nostoc sp.]|uniref:Imm32 family immunity protein n=1 Tax=Nostoc sp. TaxID=1180 RepID=UPI002FFCEB40